MEVQSGIFCKRNVKKIVGFLLVLLCLFVGTTVYAKERRVVRVAFFPMDGYHIVNDDGSYGGMDVEYLKVLASCVGWEIEYVECEAGKML